MKIHQITDLHIPEADETGKYASVRPTILKQLAYVEADASDLLVISGDLTMQDHSRAACEWLREVLPPQVETIILPGNHDDPALLWEVFGSERCINQDFCFSRPLGAFQGLFVNTHTNHLPAEQIQFIMEADSHEPALLFMHHPPNLIGAGFMTRNQPLLNHTEVSQAIEQSTVTNVFCGHYHNEADIRYDGYHLHLTPSPAFQINLHVEIFEPEPFDPAVRVIELGENAIHTYMQVV